MLDKLEGSKLQTITYDCRLCIGWKLEQSWCLFLNLTKSRLCVLCFILA